MALASPSCKACWGAVASMPRPTPDLPAGHADAVREIAGRVIVAVGVRQHETNSSIAFDLGFEVAGLERPANLLQDALTSMRFVFDCASGVLGMVTVRTPFLNSALASLDCTPRGSGIARWKAPKVRSDK